MPLQRIKLTITSAAAGPDNPAIIGFDFGGSVDAAECLASMIGYLYASETLSAGVTMTGASLATDDGPAVGMEWPGAELVALTGGAGLGTTWGETDFGAGSMAPIGTCILVTERTDIGGRHNGRLYLPWPATACFGSNGYVLASTVTQARGAYEAIFLGATASGALPAGWTPFTVPPAVRTKIGTATTAESVRTVSVSPIPATLSSRKR